MTPAIRALEAAVVPFVLHPYERGDTGHDTGHDFGREAADALGLDHDRVFKTLVVVCDGTEAVAVVPVSCRLALKAMGAALGAKRVEMCEVERAERITGFVAGGISPFGQKRRLATVVDETCGLHETIYVSGGRRGLDVEVAPADLIAVTGALVADIAV
ncbi:Cys-tRNA(Pro) deacylase [soil metagenome]